MTPILCSSCGYERKHHPVQKWNGDKDFELECEKFIADDGVLIITFDDPSHRLGLGNEWACGFIKNSLAEKMWLNVHADFMKEQLYARIMGWE